MATKIRHAPPQPKSRDVRYRPRMIGVNLIAGTGDITSAATAAIGAGTLSAPSVDVIITVTGGGPMLGAGVFAAPIVNGGAVDITVTAAAATGFGVAPVSGSVTI